jgi:glycosyltransferase involved in cell wall biosynthesis
VSEHQALAAIAGADVLVVSSFMEGLPVVVMEALAIGVPVVAPRVAGIPELVEHERTGLLFTPGHWPELTECLVRLAGDPQLRTALAAAGRRRIAAEFDARHAIEPLFRRFAGLPEDPSIPN